MALALPTDVPPNFIVTVFMSASSENAQKKRVGDFHTLSFTLCPATYGKKKSPRL
jgi:hypothetical protein